MCIVTLKLKLLKNNGSHTSYTITKYQFLHKWTELTKSYLKCMKRVEFHVFQLTPPSYITLLNLVVKFCYLDQLDNTPIEIQGSCTVHQSTKS